MSTMKKILCIVLALALLLAFGCKKDDKVETPDVPETPDTTVETPPVEQPPAEEQKQEPVINTWPDLLPETMIPEAEQDTVDLSARSAAFNSYREVGYFMEWQLGEGYTILETLPGDKDGEYMMWGVRIVEPGVREPFQLRVNVTPDGKDFSLLAKKEITVTEEWKAVQNYRWLVTNYNQGPKAFLAALGFDTVITDNVTTVSYDVFLASMLSIMTQEMYDAHWADHFWEEDGKLAMVSTFGGSDDRYIVEMVQPQEDGTYLSYEYLHDSFDTFSTYFVKVELEEQPNGTFRVASWDADNTAIMEQAQTAVPIQP